MFLRGDDALPHEETEVLKELFVLLRLLLALVQQEADDPLLQNVTELPESQRETAQKLISGAFLERKKEPERVYMPKNVGLSGCVPDEGALLQQLPAQIQRDVLAVHHTCRNTLFLTLFLTSFDQSRAG